MMRYGITGRIGSKGFVLSKIGLIADLEGGFQFCEFVLNNGHKYFDLR